MDGIASVGLIAGSMNPTFPWAVALLGLLLVVLVITLPRWSYSSRWGYGPSGIAGLAALIVIALLLMQWFR